MNMIENKNTVNAQKLTDPDLDKVSGGAFFKDFSDDQYNAAGVSVTESADHLHGSFSFKGETIQREEAGIIVDYYHFFGCPPLSAQQAMDWYRNSLSD